MATTQTAKKKGTKAHPLRFALYKKIEVGRKQVPEMADEDFFRDWLESNFGQRSRTKLSINQLSRVIDMLAKAGAEYTSRGTNKKTRGHVRPDFLTVPESDSHAQQKKAICAIWKKLGYSMTSLETRVKREFGVASFAWLQDGAKIDRLLTDLQRREKAFEKKQNME